MTSSKNALNLFQEQLTAAIQDIYTPAGMRLTHPLQPETESLEYGACRFVLNGYAIVFRVAKTTPTKLGQFVTLWKRPTLDSEIMPFDITDKVDFVVISVADATYRGQFIFSQKLLLEKGVMSREGKGGKRALRVYPPWVVPTAKAAIQTQRWQIEHFLPLAANGMAQSPELVRMFFRAT